MDLNLCIDSTRYFKEKTFIIPFDFLEVSDKNNILHTFKYHFKSIDSTLTFKSIALDNNFVIYLHIGNSAIKYEIKKLEVKIYTKHNIDVFLLSQSKVIDNKKYIIIDTCALYGTMNKFWNPYSTRNQGKKTIYVFEMVCLVEEETPASTLQEIIDISKYTRIRQYYGICTSDGKVIKINGILWAYHSEYFKVILDNNYKKERIPLPNVSSNVIEIVKECIENNKNIESFNFFPEVVEFLNNNLFTKLINKYSSSIILKTLKCQKDFNDITYYKECFDILKISDINNKLEFLLQLKNPNFWAAQRSVAFPDIWNKNIKNK